MKTFRYIVILLGLLAFGNNLLAEQLELKPIVRERKSASPLTKEQVAQAQKSDGKFLARKGYYNEEKCFEQITKLEGAVAFFANPSSGKSMKASYYNVLMRDEKGRYFFKKYSGYVASKNDLATLVHFDSRRPSSFKEVIYLEKSSVKMLLHILEKALLQAEDIGRIGLDGVTYEFGMSVNGEWQKAGVWTPLEGTMPYYLALFVDIYTQEELAKVLKTIIADLRLNLSFPL